MQWLDPTDPKSCKVLAPLSISFTRVENLTLQLEMQDNPSLLEQEINNRNIKEIPIINGGV